MAIKKKNPVNEISARELTSIAPGDTWYYFFALEGLDGAPTFFIKRRPEALEIFVEQYRSKLVKKQWFDKGELIKEEGGGNALIFRPKEFGNLNTGRKDYQGSPAKFNDLLSSALGTSIRANVVYSDEA